MLGRWFCLTFGLRIFGADTYSRKSELKRMTAVCLIGFAEKKSVFWRRIWRRLWPKLQPVGELPKGRAEHCLLPWTADELYAMPTEDMRRAVLGFLARLRRRGFTCFGWPLDLTLAWPGELPEGVTDGRELAARAFVASAGKQVGGWPGKQAALLGVELKWHRFFCDALLEYGARPVLYGARALSLAEYYYRQSGIAIPVFGVKKTIRSSDALLILDPAFAALPGAYERCVLVFREPMVQVAGSFRGRFAFGCFAAGWAAALAAGGAEILLDKN